MIQDTKEDNNLIPVVVEGLGTSLKSAIIDAPSDFSSQPSHDDTRDASSATTTTLDSYLEEDSNVSHDNHSRFTSRGIRRDIDAFERLYNEAKPKQIEGKQRRIAIERMLAKRHEPPEALSSNRKIPLSQAEDFYRRSIMWAMEKEEKLAAAASERGGMYNFKSNNSSSAGNVACARIPLSHAQDFYRKSIVWAKEKEEKLATAARDQGTTYEYQYKFKSDNASFPEEGA